jgi:hypothetical protein
MPLPLAITGTTRRMAENQDEYFTLHIRDEVMDGVPVMTSAWEFTPGELALLNAGGKLHLTIVGYAHPPVMLKVHSRESD